MVEAIPAHVVTGPLGSGKTTAIARLLARKPPEQNWVVLLNEFSDAGIDTLTVASAARGAFDVRLVPGGCLCCAGEQDFRRNLQELLTGTRPDRIIIEPSGLGHPAGIVEELLAHESAGALRLAGIVALIDPQHLRDGSLAADSDALAQMEIADSLALSKPDLADEADQARFATLAAGLFPAKAWVGLLVGGAIPLEAFEPTRLRPRDRAGSGRPGQHELERRAKNDHPNEPVAEIEAANGTRREVRHLGHRALRWVFPRSVEFSRLRLENLLASALGGDGDGDGDRDDGSAGDAADGTMSRAGRIARLKGVFRVGEDEWVLAQAGRRFVEVRPTSWRRDSRVELLVGEAMAVDPLVWDVGWLNCQRR